METKWYNESTIEKIKKLSGVVAVSNQIQKATEDNIAVASVEESCLVHGATPLLSGEIDGAAVVYHAMWDGDIEVIAAVPEKLKTFFLLSGSVIFSANNLQYPYSERMCYVADPRLELSITSHGKSNLLEISWALNTQDREYIAQRAVAFPLLQLYNDCDHYTEEFKSENTISRSIIGHRLLPRFCMGSNECLGPDKVGYHEHPLIDQFFFSFPENDVDLLIDDRKQSFKGSTLIHIPLGSSHGVEISEGKKMHYIWIDFMIDWKGMDCLDEMHIPVDGKRSI